MSEYHTVEIEVSVFDGAIDEINIGGEQVSHEVSAKFIELLTDKLIEQLKEAA